MTPSPVPNPLWSRIQQYMDDPSHRYPPKPADLSRDSGVTEQVLSKWKAKPVFPRPDHLVAFAAGTGIPYEELLKAVLEGRDYLPGPAGSAKIVLSRRMRRILHQVGMIMIEELKSDAASGPPRKPVDLSDIFSREDAGPSEDPALSDLDDTLLHAAKKGDLEDSGENSI